MTTTNAGKNSGTARPAPTTGRTPTGPTSPTATRERRCHVCGAPCQRFVCSARCERAALWKFAPPPERLRQARAAGVGDRFIRDGRLPTVAALPFAGRLAEHTGYYLCGPVRTGKTWAINALAVRALERGMTCAIINWERLQLEVRATYAPRAVRTEIELLDRLVRFEVLCIDDLAAGREASGQASDAARALLYQVLDGRYYGDRITHLTSNLPPDRLASTYDARIARRITDTGRVIVLTDPLTS